MKTDNAVMAAQIESGHDKKEFFQWILKETLKETLKIVDVDEEPRKASRLSYLKQGYMNCCNLLGSANTGMFRTVDYIHLSPPWLKHSLAKSQKVAGY